MHGRSFLLALTAGLLLGCVSSLDARAGSVLVTEDSGTFDFALTADGLGHVAITYSGVLLDKINGTSIPTGSIVSTFSGDALTVVTTILAPPLTGYQATEPVPGLKSFGTGTDGISVASVNYSITSGFALPGVLVLEGFATGVVSPLLETTATSPTVYDFSPFATRPGLIMLTYNQVGADFATVIADGGTIPGTGGFIQFHVAIVPEPKSLALLVIGMTGCFTFRFAVTGLPPEPVANLC